MISFILGRDEKEDCFTIGMSKRDFKTIAEDLYRLAKDGTLKELDTVLFEGSNGEEFAFKIDSKGSKKEREK